MSADQITDARIAELRERATTGGPTKAWRRSDYLAVLDALTASRAEVQALRKDMEDAAGELLIEIPEPGSVASKMLMANVLMRRERDTLRADVQRLTEEARQLRVMMQGQETECRHRERQDEVYRFQIAGKDAEIQRLRDELDQSDRPEFPAKLSPDGVARLRVCQYWIERAGHRTFVWVDADEVRQKLPLTEESRRSDAGRVEVPELTYGIIEECWIESVSDPDETRKQAFTRGAKEINSWWLRNLPRPSPSPQPETEPVPRTGTVTEVGRFGPYDGGVMLLASPQPSADVVVVPREEWKRIVTLLLHLIADEDAFDKIDDLMDPIGKAQEARHGKAWIGSLIEEAGIVQEPEIDDFFVCPPDALRSSTNHDSKET